MGDPGQQVSPPPQRMCLSECVYAWSTELQKHTVVFRTSFLRAVREIRLTTVVDYGVATDGWRFGDSAWSQERQACGGVVKGIQEDSPAEPPGRCGSLCSRHRGQ